eukprot:4998042-Prymnesium_polylepis.1
MIRVSRQPPQLLKTPLTRAGAAVHKGGERGAIESAYALCPKLSVRMCKAMNEMTELGEFNGIEYSACRLEDGDLQAFRASFYAARREDTLASFRLTDQQKKQYDDFAVVAAAAITTGVVAAMPD